MNFITHVIVYAINNTIDIRINDIMCHTSWTQFLEEVNCPFISNEIISINYEPTRNIFSIEKIGGQIFGRESLEIKWIEENLDLIENFARNHIESEHPLPTIEMYQQYLLSSTDWLIIRHREQKELGIETSLTDEQYSSIIEYRQTIRNITDFYPAGTLTETVLWPVNPYQTNDE